jgi:methyl-accepting chemotaxis protein
MKQFRRRYLSSIRGRATVTLLLVGLAPLGLFGGATLFLQSDRLAVEAETSLRTSGARIASEVDEWFDKSARMAEETAILPAIIGMSPEEQRPVLIAITRTYPWIYLAHVLGADGKDVSRSDDRPMLDYADRQYYRDLVGGMSGPRWETQIGKTSGKPALMLSVPISNGSRVVGVLVLAMGIEDLSKIIFAHWRTGQTGFAFLTDEQAKVMAHPRDEYVKAMVRLADHPLVAAFSKDGRPHLLSFTEAEGKKALGYVQGTSWGWAVAVQRDKDELFAPLRQTLAIGIGFLIAAIIVVVVGARAASGVLVRPILDMVRAADRMSTGDLDRPLPPMDVDELATLASSLDRLRISLRAAMARLRV